MNRHPATVLVGMGGWDLFPFEGVFYPPRKKKGFRKLEFYARFWDFVEINATFYNSSFSPIHAKRWIQEVSANTRFTFAVKLFRGFTHTFDATTEDVVRIHRLLDALAEEGKLAGLLMQFPYSFTNRKEHRRYVLRLGKLFQRFDLFVEVRHNSWNDVPTFHLLQEQRMHLVNVDLPAIKHHMPLTAESWGGTAYFRMMGRNVLTWDRAWRVNEQHTHLVSDRYLYHYTDDELKQLFTMIEALRQRINRAYVVFHNDPNANSLVNGFQLRHLIERRKLSIPSTLLRARPEVRKIALADSTPDSVLFMPQQAQDIVGHRSTENSRASRRGRQSSFWRSMVAEAPGASPCHDTPCPAIGQNASPPE